MATSIVQVKECDRHNGYVTVEGCVVCEVQALRARCEAAEVEVERLRNALRHDGFECDGCLTGGMHDITTRECIDGPNSRTATESALDRVERSRDEAREALRDCRDAILTALVPVEVGEDDPDPSPCVCDACRQRLKVAEATARRVLSGEKEGAKDGINPLAERAFGKGANQGFRAGAEWMREQAALRAEAEEELEGPIPEAIRNITFHDPAGSLRGAVRATKKGIAAGIRSLPVSQPAPEEDKP